MVSRTENTVRFAADKVDHFHDWSTNEHLEPDNKTYSKYCRVAGCQWRKRGVRIYKLA